MMKTNYIFLLFLLSIALFFSCKKADRTVSSTTVQVALQASPDYLNPFMTTNAYATIVINHIFMPLIDYDPKTLKLTPYLAESLPRKSIIDTGDLKGNYAYHYTIRPEAYWNEERAITGHDYAFSLKLLNLKDFEAPIWRTQLDFIEEVVVNKNNPKSFTVLTNNKYFKANELTGIPPLPSFFYDSTSVLSNLRLSQIKNNQFYEQIIKTNPKIQAFIQEMNSPFRMRNPEGILGAGAYLLDEWTPDREIVLKKKKDWWGKDIFSAFPDRIIYRITSDQNTAYNMMQEGLVDVISNIDAALFERAKKNASLNQEFNFFTPQSAKYYYISFNLQDPKLEDRNTRQALSYLLDRDKVISLLFQGQAEKIVGPVLPSKPYYNDALEPYNLNLEKATNLLKKSGWNDSDGDGILDREINGFKNDLSIDVLVPSAAVVNKEVIGIWIEDAKKARVDLRMRSIEFGALREALKSKDFEAFALAAGLDLGNDDLFQQWHTASMSSGSNRSSFGNTQTDSIIERIRSDISDQERKMAYLEIQRIIHAEQPFIFICTPKDRVIIRNTFENSFASTKYPGFFENYLSQRAQ